MEKDFETTEAIRDAGIGAREEARHLADEVRAKSVEALKDQRLRASGEVEGVARALRAGASCFEEQGQESFALLTREAAARVDRLSDSIRDGDVGKTMRDAERYAREHPTVVLGGALLIGFAAVRFFKASGDSQSEVEVPRTSPQGRTEDIYEH
jgi:hypothetical protein